jgi:ribonucleoside-diphosphate reductase alpha chain
LDGLPFEAFVTVGKSGSDITAISEAMGRLISYCFKITDELPEERARGIIGQLKDIGGRRFVGFGQDKIYSLPDAIARAMAKDLGIWEEEKNE